MLLSGWHFFVDKLSSTEYLKAVLAMSPEHRRCLMASEAERRRTFRGGWPDDYDWRDFAKLGYYMCEGQAIISCHQL